MKIYSVAWGWTPVPEDMPEGDSLIQIADKVKALGFDGIDYLSTFESLDEYFTDETCKKIKAHCDKIGLKIGGLVFQSDLWNNPDPQEQEKQLSYFAKCAHVADLLGAWAISCIIPRAFGGKPTRGNASPSEKRTANLPADYNFQKDWNLFADMLRKACLIAKEKGLTIALECFTGSLVSTPHAMLKIIEDVACDNFGIQFDTAHLMAQHIDPETAIYILGGKNIKNVHCKDSDGLTRGNLPAGSGYVDYTAIFKALKNVGYKGTASVEVEFTDNPARYMKQALDHVKLCLKGKY